MRIRVKKKIETKRVRTIVALRPRSVRFTDQKKKADKNAARGRTYREDAA